jgi:hypothetical protein
MGPGVVYKARDLQLSRDVAIKVTRQQLTEQFVREARYYGADPEISLAVRSRTELSRNGADRRPDAGRPHPAGRTLSTKLARYRSRMPMPSKPRTTTGSCIAI